MIEVYLSTVDGALFMNFYNIKENNHMYYHTGHFNSEDREFFCEPGKTVQDDWVETILAEIFTWEE